MFFNQNKKDDFEDLRRQEQYEFQKKMNQAKGLGYLLYLYITRSLIWAMCSITLAPLVNYVTGMHMGLATFLSMVASFFIFKIQYVKEHPFRVIVIIGFVMYLMLNN